MWPYIVSRRRRQVSRIIKTFGMVNAPPDFTKHPHVINGARPLRVNRDSVESQLSRRLRNS
jgi:hypothetical protein